MFEYYSERLNAVEMNGSFYRTPPEGVLAGWAAKAPLGFRFCFKAHRGITYSAPAFDKVGLAGDIGRRLGVLGSQAGPLLVQFPPTKQLDPELLELVLAALKLPAAAEFRHQSWFAGETYDILRRHAAALVVTDEEKWPRAPEIATGPAAYYRLRRDYDAVELAAWARRLAEVSRERNEVYVFFKHEPEAPERARAMMEAQV